jgi:DNA-binding transcriptional ArsR family regulator
LGTWEVTFEGRQDSFRDQQGAEYVVWLLLHPPPQPIHAVALEMEVSHTPGATGVIKQRSLGLDDAEAVRNLRRQAHKLAAVLEDELASERVKADARRKRAEILEFLRKNPWRSQDRAQKCVRSITRAIMRLHSHLARAVDAEGKPHPVLQAFAWHLREHLLTPSGRSGGHGGARTAGAFGGCFTYEPPPGVVWSRIED